MAAASQRKTTFISQKLTFLKDQENLLIGAVGQYVSGIIEAGESWTEGGDNKMGYLELCQIIDIAVESLCEKCDELASGSVGAEANQLLRSSSEQPDLTPEATTATASTSTTYQTLQSTSPASTTTSSSQASQQASTSPTSHRQATEVVQIVDATMLKPVSARIAVIEESLFSFRRNAKKVAEQQSGIDQQLKELLSKLSESDKKHKSRLRKVKEQISEISETQVALDQEQETRLQSLEKQLQKLSTVQDRMEVEMEFQAELTEKLVHVPDQLESVNEKLDVLDARIGRIIDDCSNKHQDIENVTRDLADKVMANTETAQVISESQHQTAILLKELETRMQTLEAESGRTVKDVQKQAEKGKTNLRMLCQMLNDRLNPLEQLRTCFNQRISTRDANIEKLSQVIQELSLISPRVQQLEVESSRTRCGFSAWAWVYGEAAGDTIRPYDTLDCNVGGNFDGDSGIFTAPVDGLYVTSISFYLRENGNVTVGVKYNKQGQGESSSTDVCESSAEVKDTTACNMAVVDMKAGDTLSCYVRGNSMNDYKIVYFSGFLLT